MKLISSVLVFCIFSVIHIECILQGDKTNIGSHPYLVSVRDSKSKAHIAGGAIISSRLILTSAHALDDAHNDPKSINILAGATDLTKDGITLNIEKIVKHKDDIALLRTDSEIVFSGIIQPISVPSSEEIPSSAIIAGWGKVKNEDKHDYTSELTSKTFATLDGFNCGLRLKEVDSQTVPTVDDNKVCTATNLPNNGICGGDIGSPIIQGTTLVGIASWYHVVAVNTTAAGYKCGNGYPDVYTRVFPYRDWIAKGDGNVVRATSFVLIAFGVTLISIF